MDQSARHLPRTVNPSHRRLRSSTRVLARRCVTCLRWHDDRGSMSVFFAVATLAVLLVMGLLVDGGKALNAANHATSLAQEAARSGGQQLDAAQAIQGTAITVDPNAAQAAAEDYLAHNGVQGDVNVTDNGRTLHVTVHSTYRTLFGSLIGKSSIAVTGTAKAHLQTHAGG
ncbi:TadE/TadG family type IV pilus assembly protein [Streptomyces platensis]|uniref:TadE/TadG family type IV pilus assembly protein n=1 Tax=Streptomyces platensis TaxID=58346 RepID=UPI0037AF73F9